MNYKEAIEILNRCSYRVFTPGHPCEGYEVSQIEKALEALSKELERTVKAKFS